MITPSRRSPLVRQLLAVVILPALVAVALAAEPVEIRIGYLRGAENKTAISLLDVPPDNDGVAGAQLAIADNNTTGRFLNQRFRLEEVRLKEADDPAAAVTALADRGISTVIADLSADALLKAADGGRERGLLFFNVGAPDDRLREEDCRANVIHTAPTRSMLADGLAQYLAWKKWRRWLLVVGSHPKDKLYADALRRAAARFGAKIVQERVFEDTGGARRTDSGIVQIQRQIPCSPNRRPTTTCWSRPTRAKCSRAICRIAPGKRGRSRAPLASFRKAGTRRTINGARTSCRIASSRCSSAA